jgi:hypothetical protein
LPLTLTIDARSAYQYIIRCSRDRDSVISGPSLLIISAIRSDPEALPVLNLTREAADYIDRRVSVD